MPAFYLTLIAVLLAGIGARDQGTVAGLVVRQGPRPGVLIVALASSLLTAVFAAWAASILLTELPPPARAIFAAIALGMAGLESLLLAPRRDPREPTHSLGALLLVLILHQATDAARFLVFGMSVGFGSPVPAAIGGVLGGGLLVAFAWGWPHLLGTPAARWTRRVMGGVLTLAAVIIALGQFGIL